MLRNDVRESFPYSWEIVADPWGAAVAFWFEDQVVDPRLREVSRAGIRMAVEPRVFDLLVYLIANRERVVSKDELLADVWGGRIVSDAALTGAINAARQAIGDNGREQRLIRTIARKGFRFIGALSNTGSTTESHPALPDGPSIAVLPFANMSGDPDQEYFADGVVDDIITALSRFKSLLVIARGSSFTYKGKVVDIRQVGKDLGARYVLEGSVRKAGGRMRIASQLIDSLSGAHLWADRFDGELTEVFELQDRIASDVAGRLPLAIQQAEIDRAALRPTSNLRAYDSLLLGMKHLHVSTRQSVDTALKHFYRAIELDPQYSDPNAWAAIAYSRRKQAQWMIDTREECAEGARLGRRAVELRPDNPLALSAAGFALAWLAADVPAGIDFTDRALALNPNDARAWHGSGWIRCYNGDPDTAVEHIDRAERLSPIDPQMSQFQLAKCLAHFCAGRYEAATQIARTIVQRHPYLPPAYLHLARSAAKAGHMDEARRAMTSAVQLNPALRRSNISTATVMRRPEDAANLLDAYRLAGMPD
jgi:TolB-like protein/Flp pilus assembly protein TadD